MTRAPWTEQQVYNLNEFQRDYRRHSYTCGYDSSHVLEATVDGWICPTEKCNYTQDWAHESDLRGLPW